MTPEEAKTKWCPDARVYTKSGSFNSWGLGSSLPSGTQCRAIDCMAWKWRKNSATHGYCSKYGDQTDDQ